MFYHMSAQMYLHLPADGSLLLWIAIDLPCVMNMLASRQTTTLKSIKLEEHQSPVHVWTELTFTSVILGYDVMHLT